MGRGSETFANARHSGSQVRAPVPPRRIDNQRLRRSTALGRYGVPYRLWGLACPGPCKNFDVLNDRPLVVPDLEQIAVSVQPTPGATVEARLTVAWPQQLAFCPVHAVAGPGMTRIMLRQ